MANTRDDDQYTDEFHDDSYGQADDNLSNDENTDNWDDGDYPEDESLDQENRDQANTSEKKKKSSLSTIIIIAVAVIGGLGFLVLNFGGGDTTAPTEQTNGGEEIAAADTLPVPPPETIPQNVVDSASSDQGFMIAPEEVENVVIKKPEPPPVIDTAPANITVEPPPILPPADISGDIPVADIPTSQPTTEFPTVANILKPQPDTKGTPADITVMPTPTVEVVPASIQTAPDVVKQSKEYEEMKANLDLANQKIAELEKKIEDQARLLMAEPANNSAEIEELQGRVAELQAKLQEKTSAATNQKPKVVRESVRKAPVDKFPAVQPNEATRWTLRSASSGKAILYNKGLNEIKSVRVGDRIPSIGTITSIEKVAGNWVVKGSSGQISR